MYITKKFRQHFLNSVFSIQIVVQWNLLIRDQVFCLLYQYVSSFRGDWACSLLGGLSSLVQIEGFAVYTSIRNNIKRSIGEMLVIIFTYSARYYSNELHHFKLSNTAQFFIRNKILSCVCCEYHILPTDYSLVHGSSPPSSNIEEWQREKWERKAWERGYTDYAQSPVIVPLLPKHKYSNAFRQIHRQTQLTAITLCACAEG